MANRKNIRERETQFLRKKSIQIASQDELPQRSVWEIMSCQKSSRDLRLFPSWEVVKGTLAPQPPELRLPERRTSGWWAITATMSFPRPCWAPQEITAFHSRTRPTGMSLHPELCGLSPLENFLGESFWGMLFSKTEKCCSEACKCVPGVLLEGVGLKGLLEFTQ